MYKKLILSVLFLVVGVFSSIVSADASSVTMVLCDETKQNFMINAGEKKEFCLEFYNASSEEYTILYDWRDGFISEFGSPGCLSERHSKGNFDKIFLDTKTQEFVIGPGEKKIIKEDMMVPVGMEGTVYGCISYHVKGSTHYNKGAMFSVLVSRVLPISIFVGGTSDIINKLVLLPNTGGEFSNNNKVKATVDKENNLQLSFKLQNNGNIEQNVSISGKVYNMLGFEKDFAVPVKKVGVGEISEFLVNVGILPFYKGFFTVKFYIENTPYFSFNVDNLSDEIKKGEQIKDTAKIYIFSWITLIIIVVLLLLIIKLLPFNIFRKNK